MQERRGAYRREDGSTLIEIRLASVRQLFNSLDPAPFHEKDLDRDAEAYIVDSVGEFPPDEPMKLVFHLPPAEAARAGDLGGAIRNYFAYRRQMAERELRHQRRDARFTLAVATLFLVLCLSLRQAVLALGEGVVSDIAAEGLLITGWVAMWRPIEGLLYEWWPLRRRARTVAKIERMPVEVREIAE